MIFYTSKSRMFGTMHRGIFSINFTSSVHDRTTDEREAHTALPQKEESFGQ